MEDFKKKRTFKRRLYSKLVLIVLLIIFIFVLRGAWDIYKKATSSQEKLRVAQETHVTLETKKASIEEQIARLETETGIEEEIRSKFDVVRDGEHIIVIVDAEQDATTTVETRGGVRGFFTTLFSWFQ